MDDLSQRQYRLKILIGAAWIDGRVQPEERQYLHRIAKEQVLDQDPEIHPLLHELVSVKPEQCYEWIRAYLGANPTADSCQSLMEAISALIYSDGEMAVEEAKLISRVQLLDPSNQPLATPPDRLVAGIRKLYQNWLGRQA